MWWILVPVILVAAFMAAAGWYASGKIIQRRVPDEATHPSEYGLAHEEVAFTTEDGVPLKGWLIPAQNPAGAVIFCHGHAGSMDPDLKYAPWFIERGLSVLMFDFRGHGRSGGQHVSMGTFERRDLLAAEAFLAERGYSRIGVLGFSMGGAVAISTAPVARHIRAVAADGSFAWLRHAIAAGAHEMGVPGALARAMGQMAVRIAGWRLGANLEEADPARWVGRIAPRALLLIHGEDDRYTSTEDVRMMFATAGEPKELWVVQGAGHRNVDDVEPEAYKEKVLTFFERWLKGGET
jgi:alpha-beta hydrolase superfamily lysophospholipase